MLGKRTWRAQGRAGARQRAHASPQTQGRGARAEGGEQCGLGVQGPLPRGAQGPRGFEGSLTRLSGPAVPRPPGLVSHRGAGSSQLTPLWFADERDPAGHSVHQAQPLGQEQPICTPCGPVYRVSREAAAAVLLLRTHPQTNHEKPSAFTTRPSPRCCLDVGVVAPGTGFLASHPPRVTEPTAGPAALPAPVLLWPSDCPPGHLPWAHRPQGLPHQEGGLAWEPRWGLGTKGEGPAGRRKPPEGQAEADGPCGQREKCPRPAESAATSSEEPAPAGGAPHAPAMPPLPGRCGAGVLGWGLWPLRPGRGRRARWAAAGSAPVPLKVGLDVGRAVSTRAFPAPRPPGAGCRPAVGFPRPGFPELLPGHSQTPVCV